MFRTRLSSSLLPLLGLLEHQPFTFLPSAGQHNSLLCFTLSRLQSVCCSDNTLAWNSHRFQPPAVLGLLILRHACVVCRLMKSPVVRHRTFTRTTLGLPQRSLCTLDTRLNLDGSLIVRTTLRCSMHILRLYWIPDTRSRSPTS